MGGLVVTIFYMVRHGETEWSRDGNRYCGRSDIPLTEMGTLQATLLAALLHKIPFDAAVVSPLTRARNTAIPIVKRLGIDMQVDPRLQEIDFGDWEGLTPPEIEARFPRQWAEWTHDPLKTPAGRSGETAKEVFERMTEVLSEYQHCQNVLIVSHTTAMRLVMAGTLGMPFRHYRKLEINTGDVYVLNMTNMAEIKWRALNWLTSPLGVPL
jgi:broad specificity phosphatase PhoE